MRVMHGGFITCHLPYVKKKLFIYILAKQFNDNLHTNIPNRARVYERSKASTTKKIK